MTTGERRRAVEPVVAASPAVEPVTAAPRSRTLRMIGNAHIDPVWLWRWPEGMQEVWATFRSALDRLAEYPEAIFTASSAAFYDWIERTDPAMFDEIRARVAEGRWALVGGWWVEPDCNLPAAESFARHALYAQRYFRRAFGRIATVGYNPDSFGHNAMLPQLLAKGGLRSYVFMRPQPHEADLPGRVFWWEAPDGSRVLTARIVHEYCSPTDDLERYMDATLAKLGAEEWHDLLCFYGVGNHGGGPTKANLDGIRRMAADEALPELRHARPEDYFAAVRGNGAASLPVWTSELQHHARGCYSVHSGVKAWNRSTEQLLLASEKVAALARWQTGVPYPGDFETAWRAVLFNQFHDILAGTSLEAAYDDARDGYGEARSIATRNLHAGLAAIARRIEIPLQPDAWPIVVFNPHAWPVRVPVSLEFRRIDDRAVLVDETDRAVPFQLAQSGATVNGSRTRPLWFADLPPMGYRVYRLLGGATAGDALPPVATDVATGTEPDGSAWAETDRLRLDVGAGGGCWRLREARSGEVLISCGGRGVVLRDPGDTWAHGVERFDDVLGEFDASGVRVVEAGPVRAVIRIESRFGSSRLVQDVALYRDSDRVEVAATLDWRERHAVLKLRVEAPIGDVSATYEIPYGAIERPADGAEEPGQAWVDVSGRSTADEAARSLGFSLINDSKSGYDVASSDDGASIGMTVARSPIYAHHEPKLPDPDGEYSYVDAGVQRFRYAVVPHRGDWRSTGTVRAAAEFLQEPIALPETFHAGPLPQRASLASVDHRAIVVSAIKASEDDPDVLVVRAVETWGRPARATLTIAGIGPDATTRWIDGSFGPFEIKTFLVPRDPARPIVEANLLEDAE